MLFTLSIPWLQDQLNIFSIKPLYGVATLTEKPTINFKHWWDGNFQTEYSKRSPMRSANWGCSTSTGKTR